MATAIKDRAHPIPLGPDFSTGTRLAFGWTVAATDNMPPPITSHLSPLTVPPAFPAFPAFPPFPAFPAFPAFPGVPGVTPTHTYPSALDWATNFASGPDLA